jgi:tetrahydromethanopterin S-methyltransferase subunit H
MIKRKTLPLASNARAPSRAVGTDCVVGTIVGWSQATRQFVVDFAGNTQGPVRSLSTVQVSEAEADALAEAEARVLLAFDRHDPSLPIVTGILRDAVAAPSKALVLQHAERIELRCGQAVLVLTKDGKVLTRAAYISAHSSGAYRVRSGSIEMN